MDHKIAKVRVSTEYLAQIMRGDIAFDGFIRTNAPSDLKVVGLAAIPDQIYVGYVYCESEMFEPVPEGAEPPEIPPFEYTIIKI